jgi:hypothetical protein
MAALAVARLLASARSALAAPVGRAAASASDRDQGGPSCSEPMAATDHEPSVKTRPLPPVAEVGLLKVRNARTRFMTDEEENQLMSTCWPRLRPIVIAALHTGLRREELATLT